MEGWDVLRKRTLQLRDAPRNNLLRLRRRRRYLHGKDAVLGGKLDFRSVQHGRLEPYHNLPLAIDKRGTNLYLRADRFYYLVNCLRNGQGTRTRGNIFRDRHGNASGLRGNETINRRTHLCHDRSVVALDGLAISDLAINFARNRGRRNRLRRSNLARNRLVRNRLWHIWSGRNNRFCDRRIIYRSSNRLNSRLWRYLHKFSSILTIFRYLYRVSPHDWHNFYSVGLDIYGVCPNILDRAETSNNNSLYPSLGRNIHGVSIQLAKRSRINGNPVARLNGRRRSILNRNAHFCHDRNIVARNGLPIRDLAFNRRRRNRLRHNGLAHSRIGRNRLSHNNYF